MKNIKKHNLYLLTTGIILFINAFLYFFNKLFISDYNLIGSSLDNFIPFWPQFIYFYVIWYPFVIICLYFLYKADEKNYIKTLIALVLSLIVKHCIFIFYPTMIERPIVDSFNSLTTFILYVVFKSDTPVNCFPSGHCLICFIIIFSILNSKNMSLKTKFTTVTINTLIILSTLFVKQHVIYDVLIAFVISIVNFYFFSNLKIFDKIKNKFLQSKL